jgi:hypothetical protein
MQRPHVLIGLGLVAVISAALFAGAPIAQADTRYAEPNGDGPEPCANLMDPCDIELAVEGDTMPPMPGDEVILLPGTYMLDGGLFIGENFSVRGQTGQPRPLIMAPGGIGMEMSESSTTPPSLREVHIISSSGGLATGGGVVERVTVTSTAVSGVACSVYEREGVDGLIRDSICRQTAGGAAVGLSWGGPASTRGQLVNVTAVSPEPGGAGISLNASGNGAAEIAAVNTIARGALVDVRATDDASVGASATVTLTRSNYATEDDSGASTVTDPGTNANQTAPPLFVSAGDLHQLPGSPTVDAGIADPLLGSFDFEGNPRIIGSAPDIGGDEFMPAPPAGPASQSSPSPVSTPRKKCKKAKKKRSSAAAKKKRCKKRKKR